MEMNSFNEYRDGGIPWQSLSEEEEEEEKVAERKYSPKFIAGVSAGVLLVSLPAIALLQSFRNKSSKEVKRRKLESADEETAESAESEDENPEGPPVSWLTVKSAPLEFTEKPEEPANAPESEGESIDPKGGEEEIGSEPEETNDVPQVAPGGSLSGKPSPPEFSQKHEKLGEAPEPKKKGIDEEDGEIMSRMGLEYIREMKKANMQKKH